MRIKHLLRSLVTGPLLLLLAGPVWAEWRLDNGESSLHFISVKNASVAEVHRFESLSGSINAEGEVRLDIDLDSVNTLVEIRDERMRELLFETVNFPTASIRGTIDPALLEQGEPGSVVATDVEVTLSLHGAESAVTAPLLVFHEAGRRLRVISSQPVIINAAQFDLAGGVAALRDVVELSSISTAVPVSFHLLFAAGPDMP